MSHPTDTRGPAVLYDNHPPKGHHRHISSTQAPYQFETIAKLLSDFETSIKEYAENYR